MKRALTVIVMLLCVAFGGAVAQTAPTGQRVLSDTDLLHMAGNPYAAGELPLGDDRYTINQPRLGYIDLCRHFGRGHGGADRNGPWIHGNTWNIHQKTAVQGNVAWPDAKFSDTSNGHVRTLIGNDLPIGHGTGIFPIRRGDPAYRYDRNPNAIRPQILHEVLPAHPVYASTPYCMGMEAGVMLDGVYLFNGFDAELRDAAAHEMQDSCDAHPQRFGVYHYHSLSSCIADISEKTVIGYALDGFPITGPVVAPGKYLTTRDLDVCHGITSAIIQDGRRTVTYHYVMTMDFPYSVSCFRARPTRTGPPGLQPQDGTQQNVRGRMRPAGFDERRGPGSRDAMRTNGAPRRPPPEAIDACSGRSDGVPCNFVTPRGDSLSGTCHAPPQTPLACMPGSPPR